MEGSCYPIDGNHFCRYMPTDPFKNPGPPRPTFPNYIKFVDDRRFRGSKNVKGSVGTA